MLTRNSSLCSKIHPNVFFLQSSWPPHPPPPPLVCRAWHQEHSCPRNEELHGSIITVLPQTGGFAIHGRQTQGVIGGVGVGVPGAPLGAFIPTNMDQVGFQPQVQSRVSQCSSLPGCMWRTCRRRSISPITSPALRSCEYETGRMGEMGGVFKAALQVLTFSAQDSDQCD